MSPSETSVPAAPVRKGKRRRRRRGQALAVLRARRRPTNGEVLAALLFGAVGCLLLGTVLAAPIAEDFPRTTEKPETPEGRAVHPFVEVFRRAARFFEGLAAAAGRSRTVPAGDAEVVVGPEDAA